MTINDNYTHLYHEKSQEATWYKQPNTRRNFKRAGIITVIALIVVASISAHALSSPLSQIGTLGHNLMGSQGLIGCTAAGFTGSAVSAVMLIIYLSKTLFRVSDYLDEDKGFLYVIKDNNETVRAYLFGTIHIMPENWEGINFEIQKKIDECRTVFVECNEMPEETNEVSLLSIIGQKRGLDFKIIDYANDHEIEVEQFETLEEQQAMLKHVIEATIIDTVDSLKSFTCCSSKQTISLNEQLDRMLVAWKTGDEIAINGGIGINTTGRHSQVAYRELSYNRNIAWMPRIEEELNNESTAPIFIAVGAMHLFDVPKIESHGLITLLKDQNWIVERVEET